MRIPLKSKHGTSGMLHMEGWDDRGYRHMGKLYTTSEEYYRMVVTNLPINPNDPRGEAVVGADIHGDVCERLSRSGAYAVSFNPSEEYLYVDNWSIDDACLYHRHPELRLMGTHNLIQAHLEWDVLDNRCGMCDKQVPGEIWMMWRLQQI